MTALAGYKRKSYCLDDFSAARVMIKNMPELTMSFQTKERVD